MGRILCLLFRLFSGPSEGSLTAHRIFLSKRKSKIFIWSENTIIFHSEKKYFLKTNSYWLWFIRQEGIIRTRPGAWIFSALWHLAPLQSLTWRQSPSTKIIRKLRLEGLWSFERANIEDRRGKFSQEYENIARKFTEAYTNICLSKPSSDYSLSPTFSFYSWYSNKSI